jgi:hypothetical protein
MFAIIYIDSRGKQVVHDYRPTTRAEALGVGHELTRDFVAQFFKVIRLG